MSEQVQRGTFYLLGCETCGRFDKPPKPFRCDVAEPSAQPMRCSDCGDLLLLVEGWVAPETEMWQAKRGSMWRHVVFPESLPESTGRQIWTVL